MCGIIGYAGERDAAPFLLDALQRLEYRGYDSAGIAVMDGGAISIARGAGKLSALRSGLEGAYPVGATGIGHTRWATHGKPTEANAHPHRDCAGEVVVIHNGIVENYLDLREELRTRGHQLRSETDTEVMPHLIEACLDEGDDLLSALRRTIARLRGAHAIVAMSAREPGAIVAARVGNAGGVVIGYGRGEMFVASDLSALLPETQDVAFLDDGEIARVTPAGASYIASDGTPLQKARQTVPFDPVSAARGAYKHFMLKEIMEQPECIMDTFRGRAIFDPPAVELEGLRMDDEAFRGIERVVLVGMGTSMHAAHVGRTYFERIAGIPAELDNSSEFRYRDALIGPGTLVVSVAQSGETVDTLEAMADARRRGAPQITICNTPGAQTTRVAGGGTVLTRCGPEVAVASTKTLTASITALYLLACRIARARGVLDAPQLGALVNDLARIPDLMGRVLKLGPEIDRIAASVAQSRDFLFLARGLQFPMALEGALKLKEVSYIHAEGYPAGEMKHGPIALIDRDMPVVAIALDDGTRDKMLSNIEQVRARDGIVIGIVSEGDAEIAAKCHQVLELPRTTPLLYPLLSAIPMQLLSYHIAVRRGCDVDQPRNLAKTVTVE
ncbi:MAG TPA: glutamine--fructose-6-phosphate transaminase (isomerizing) [Dehalococcoidia bacterium]|nr:glutamine--fructose-6-phosphate transaminase (isomerizing) [Dehalococcoidia bacterium]